MTKQLNMCRNVLCLRLVVQRTNKKMIANESNICCHCAHEVSSIKIFHYAMRSDIKLFFLANRSIQMKAVFTF